MAGGENRPLVLIIMDGWGLTDYEKGNAVCLARTPNFDHLFRKFPSTRLECSGEAVGLPGNQMGNSEVGHLNLGAGRIVLQDMLRISRAIEDGSFFVNEVLIDVMDYVITNHSSLHLMGLLSDGGVHSHNTHLYALLKMAKKKGLEKVYVHALLDGRDVPPKSAAGYLEELEKQMALLNVGKIASIAGRYYTMDRDRHWERTQKSYQAYVYGKGESAKSSLSALQDAYNRGETDEFVSPTVILNQYNNEPSALINSGDGLIFFNFRADRARQISRIFTEVAFEEFDRGVSPAFPYYVCFTEYDRLIKAPVVFPPEYLNATLGEVVSANGLRQLRVAETEKYAHVTYFFNGGLEKPFSGEERILVPSPRVATYDLKPEMSAGQITGEVLEALESNKFCFIVMNYANADMVGHTGKLNEAIKAVETVDMELGKVVNKVLHKGGIAIVTSDHGNAEMMLAEDGTPHTAHTNNDTPLILVAERGTHRLPPRGKLADVAPTILKLLSLPVPQEMDGTSLI
ncbi:MAG: 2,3-bisphosphoglycerate-independent phosphoglycerate mutase [Dethiobacteria bacterium]